MTTEYSDIYEEGWLIDQSKRIFLKTDMDLTNIQIRLEIRRGNITTTAIRDYHIDMEILKKSILRYLT